MEMDDEHKDGEQSTGTDSYSSGSAASAAASRSEHHKSLDLLVAFRAVMRILTDPKRLDDGEAVDDDMNVLCMVRFLTVKFTSYD